MLTFPIHLPLLLKRKVSNISISLSRKGFVINGMEEQVSQSSSFFFRKICLPHLVGFSSPRTSLLQRVCGLIFRSAALAEIRASEKPIPQCFEKDLHPDRQGLMINKRLSKHRNYHPKVESQHLCELLHSFWPAYFLAGWREECNLHSERTWSFLKIFQSK